MLGKKRSGAVCSWALVLLVSAFAIYPVVAHPLEEIAHDAAFFHVYRGVVFSAAQADGWLFPRWVQPINAGLGGPLFSFYSPMLYFLMAGLHGLGVAHPLGWRLIAAAALLVATAGMFQLGLSLFKRADVALLCTACFLYAPHLLEDIFERGSPQGLPIVLYPWLLWALLRLAEHPSGWRLALASVCWAAMLLLHTAAALWLLPVIGVFLIFLVFRIGKVALRASLLALLVGSLLAAFYLAPFAADRRYVQSENNHKDLATQPALHPLPLSTLLAPPAIFDSGLDRNTMGHTLGLLHAPLLVVGLAYSLALWRRRRYRDMVLPAGLALLGLTSVWLQTAWATPIWRALPALSVLEFRWRLQSTMGLLAALILGSLLAVRPQRFRGTLVTVLIAAYVGLQLPSLYPQLLPRWADFTPPPTVADAQAYALENNVPGLSAFSEEQPIWRRAPFTVAEAERAASSPLANLPQGATVQADKRRTGSWQVQVKSPTAFSAAFHLLYFPGWAGYVDGRRQTIRPMADTGYAMLDIPAGSHTIDLRYEGTLAQHIGDAISGLTLTLLLGLTVLWRGGMALHLADDVAYPEARWWLPAALVVLVGLKAFWIDPHTNLLRWSSTCQAVHGAQIQTDIWFGESLHLCGYSISRPPLHPGDTLRVTLYWETKERLENPAYSFVHLLGAISNPKTGNPVWAQQDKKTPGKQPVGEWVPGRLYCDTYEFQVPPETPKGEYTLEVGWWQPDVGTRLLVGVGRPAEGQSVLDSFSVPGFRIEPSLWMRVRQKVERLFLTRRMQHPRQEILGQSVRLLGYDLEPALKPGQTAHLRLYWQVLAPIPTDYKVFVHLLDDKGQQRSGHDGVPVNGIRPTTSWEPREILTDLHEIPVPADAQPGRYTIEIGLYEETTLVRLPAYDAAGTRLEQDRILLADVTIH